MRNETKEMLIKSCNKLLNKYKDLDVSRYEEENDCMLDFIDIEYIVGASFDEGICVKEVKFTVALGGPTIYLTTDGTDMRVEGYWGSDRYECYDSDNSTLFDTYEDTFRSYLR